MIADLSWSWRATNPDVGSRVARRYDELLFQQIELVALRDVRTADGLFAVVNGCPRDEGVMVELVLAISWGKATFLLRDEDARNVDVLSTDPRRAVHANSVPHRELETEIATPLPPGEQVATDFALALLLSTITYNARSDDCRTSRSGQGDGETQSLDDGGGSVRALPRSWRPRPNTGYWTRVAGNQALSARMRRALRLPMTEPFESTFVLFVDMLGFADLVEQDGNELLNELNAVFNSIELYDPLPSASLLGYRFMNFHQCVNRARDRLEAIGNGTGIVFSDSAFFRIDDLKKAIGFARELMFDLVTSEVPARMGLASGSYRMLRFVADSSDQVLFHMSQFLGTGIVRAHKAEACGLPGLRILLHPHLEGMLEKESLRIVAATPVENVSTHIGDAWRAAGLLPIAMDVQCTGSIAPGPGRIRDSRHRLLKILPHDICYRRRNTPVAVLRSDNRGDTLCYRGIRVYNNNFCRSPCFLTATTLH